MRLALPDRTIAYWERGQGSKACVLIHGLGSKKEEWLAVAEHLPADMRVIALDLPGHGENPADDFGCSMADFAGVLGQALTALGVHAPLLVGHSMGAQIAVTYLLSGGTARALVMVAPAGIETFEPLEGRWLVAVENAEAYVSMPLGLTGMRMRQLFYKEPPDLAARVRERFTRMASADGLAYAGIFHRSVKGMIEGPVYARLGELTLPTCIVFGEHDARIPNKLFHPSSTRAVGESALALMPQARLVVLPEVGHMVPEEAPARLAQEVLQTV